MAQPEYNWTNLGVQTTSTGTVVIRSGPGILQALTINSTGTGSSVFYDATTSSTGKEIITLGGVPTGTLWYNIVLREGLTRGNTTSTTDVTVTWA